MSVVVLGLWDKDEVSVAAGIWSKLMLSLMNQERNEKVSSAKTFHNGSTLLITAV